MSINNNNNGLPNFTGSNVRRPPLAQSSPVVDMYNNNSLSDYATQQRTSNIGSREDNLPYFARNYGFLVNTFSRLFQNPMLGRFFMAIIGNSFNNLFPPPLAPSLDGVANNSKLESFESVLKASKFDKVISEQESKGPVTIFAPTEKAFEKLPLNVKDALLKPENKATLDKILAYHVAEKPVSFKDEPQNIDSIREDTLDKSVLTGKAENPTIINGKQIVNGGPAQILKNNTVVIPIDDILIPPDVDLTKLIGFLTPAPNPNPTPNPSATASAENVLKNNTNLKTLNGLLGSAGLVSTLQNAEKSKPVTILAPTEVAFDKLDPKVKTALLKPENKGVLKQILEYHVSANVVTPNGSTQPFDSLREDSTDFNVLSGSADAPRIINGRQIVKGEKAVAATNQSLIIPIEEVLIPPGLDLSKLV
jgi:uncharacterized surface protein with fasciclin (FAS1) repeats